MQKEHERDLRRVYGFLHNWQGWGARILKRHALDLPDGFWGDHMTRRILSLIVRAGMKGGAPAAGRLVRRERAKTAKVVAKARRTS
jgi:hypothetical protein